MCVCVCVCVCVSHGNRRTTALCSTCEENSTVARPRGAPCQTGSARALSGYTRPFLHSTVRKFKRTWTRRSNPRLKCVRCTERTRLRLRCDQAGTTHTHTHTHARARTHTATHPVSDVCTQPAYKLMHLCLHVCSGARCPACVCVCVCVCVYRPRTSLMHTRCTCPCSLKWPTQLCSHTTGARYTHTQTHAQDTADTHTQATGQPVEIPKRALVRST